MEMPRHNGCSNTARFVVFITILCLFCGIDGKDQEHTSKFSRKHVKKKHLMNHRLEKQTGNPSLYQTYRYDHDVNIGKF